MLWEDSNFTKDCPLLATPSRPGDPGWVARARVPRAAGADYVRRPEWQNDADLSKIKKKEVGQMDDIQETYLDPLPPGH